MDLSLNVANGLTSIHITENMMPTLELLMLDSRYWADVLF